MKKIFLLFSIFVLLSSNVSHSRSIGCECDEKYSINSLIEENYKLYIKDFRINFEKLNFNQIYDTLSPEVKNNISKENFSQVLFTLRSKIGKNLNSINISKSKVISSNKSILEKITFISEFDDGITIEHFIFHEIDKKLYLYGYEVNSNIDEILNKISNSTNQKQLQN